MKTAVVYSSKTGFTQKYAEWIAGRVNADLYRTANVRAKELAGYDCIVFGGSLHAVGINGMKKIQKLLPFLDGKKIIVFAVGASPKKRGIEDEIRTQNFTPQQEEEIQLFYLRGGVHISKLGVYDKLLMALLKMKLKRKKHLDADERGMLSAYSHPVDFTKEGYIEEIAAAVNQYGTTL